MVFVLYARKCRYALNLEHHNNSNTYFDILKIKYHTVNLINNDETNFKEASRLHYPRLSKKDK